jgi:phosphoribosylpyrophosphate synthetase
MVIFIGDNRDSYAGELATEYLKIAQEHALTDPSVEVPGVELYNFCTKHFNTEVKIRLYEGECVNDPKCEMTCQNPDSLGNKIENDDVFFVVRGTYGEDWDSNKMLEIAKQGAEVLKSGDPEYFGGKKAKRLCLVIPHEPYTKQDHIFLDDDGVEQVRAEPITIRQHRRELKNAGYDMMFTVYPHDFRREGWIKKWAKNGELHRYVDPNRFDPEDLTVLEDWTGFAWAINPTELFAKYSRTHRMIPEVPTAPDATGNSLTTIYRKGLGIRAPRREQIIDKKRLRADSSLEVKKGFDKEMVEKRIVSINDDWALTCGTLTSGIEEADSKGAKMIYVNLVHGEFVKKAYEDLDDIKLENVERIELVVMDTVVNPAAKIPTAEEVAERLYCRDDLGRIKSPEP